MCAGDGVIALCKGDTLPVSQRNSGCICSGLFTRVWQRARLKRCLKRCYQLGCPAPRDRQSRVRIHRSNMSLSRDEATAMLTNSITSPHSLQGLSKGRLERSIIICRTLFVSRQQNWEDLPRGPSVSQCASGNRFGFQTGQS